MLYSGILGLHIITAVLTGIVLLYALYVLGFKKSQLYQLSMLLIGFIASLQVVTGVVLAELSSTISAMSLSLHMFEYLGICLFVEVLLFVRTKKFTTRALTV